MYLLLAALGLCGFVQAFSSCDTKGYSSLQCGDFPLRWLLLLQSMGPRVCGLQQLRHMVLFAPWHEESSRARDQTHVPCIGRWILNHWTTVEVSATSLHCCADVTLRSC